MPFLEEGKSEKELLCHFIGVLVEKEDASFELMTPVVSVEHGMNCYICLIKTGHPSRPAFAICQRCGAGMCEDHLITVTTAPLVGLAGDTATCPRRSLICSLCGMKKLPSPQPAEHQRMGQVKRGVMSLYHWWRGLTHQQSDALPGEEDAVAFVEQWLKRQRDH